MNKTYHFELPWFGGTVSSNEFGTIEECVAECKCMCQVCDVDYNSPEVKLFFTDDFGATYEECTKEGELAG